MATEIDHGEAPDFSIYHAKINILNTSEYVTPSDLLDLLITKQSALGAKPFYATTDLKFLGYVRDHWSNGDRTAAFEYALREAFTGDLLDKEAYKNRASFWLKCAEGLLNEPMCVTFETYESVQTYIKAHRNDDPELYNMLEAAAAYNWMNTEEIADKVMANVFYEDYVSCRAELFGPTITPNS